MKQGRAPRAPKILVMFYCLKGKAEPWCPLCDYCWNGAYSTGLTEIRTARALHPVLVKGMARVLRPTTPSRRRYCYLFYFTYLFKLLHLFLKILFRAAFYSTPFCGVFRASTDSSNAQGQNKSPWSICHLVKDLGEVFVSAFSLNWLIKMILDGLLPNVLHFSGEFRNTGASAGQSPGNSGGSRVPSLSKYCIRLGRMERQLSD